MYQYYFQENKEKRINKNQQECRKRERGAKNGQQNLENNSKDKSESISYNEYKWIKIMSLKAQVS